jgi:hypothetical protein
MLAFTCHGSLSISKPVLRRPVRALPARTGDADHFATVASEGWIGMHTAQHQLYHTGSIAQRACGSIDDYVQFLADMPRQTLVKR